MSNQQNEEFTSEELLKFMVFVLRAYEAEYEAPITVDSDLLAAVIDQEAELDLNLIISREQERTVIGATLSEDG